MEKHHVRRRAACFVAADDRGSRRVGHSQPLPQTIIARHRLGIAAEKDVRAAPRHVGGHGDGALAAGLGDNVRFAFVLLRVQNLVRDAGLLEQCRQVFGFLDGDRSKQNRLAAFVELADAVCVGAVLQDHAVYHRYVFFLSGAIHHVGKFVAAERPVGRDGNDVEVVDLAELCRFGFRGARHTGKLFVHAEIILEGDGRQGLVFALDLHGFLGFDSLVKAVRPAPAGHLAARKFIDDDDLAVFDDVIHVPLVERMCAQSLINVVNRFHVGGVIEIAEPEQPLDFADAFLGQRGRAVFFVERVVDFLDELGDDLVDAVVLVGGFFGGPRDDERSARFVNQDRIDLVDDGGNWWPRWTQSARSYFILSRK